MLRIIIIIFLIFSVSCFARSKKCQEKFNEKINSKSTVEYKLEEEKLSIYSKNNFTKEFGWVTWTCKEIEESVDCHKVDVTSTTYAVKCSDGTASFSQPASSGKSGGKSTGKKSGYEGKCGPTAAANVFHAYCDGNFVDPLKISDKYFDDITPGVRPGVLEEGLNDLFSNNSECKRGYWSYKYVEDRWTFLNNLKFYTHQEVSNLIRKNPVTKKSEARSPVIALISKSEDGEPLHYVTVIDVIGFDNDDSIESEKCKVIINEFGGQKNVSCETFAKWGRNVDNATLTSWLHEYIYFPFKEYKWKY